MGFLEVVCTLLLLPGLIDSFNLETSHPIIYEVPDDSERSYFGMSVAIRAKAGAVNGSWTIQVGAPRGSGEGKGAREPGAVYRCHTYGPCRRFPLDQGASDVGGHGKNAYKQKKDGAWIGVAMDVVDMGAYERSLLCGHRWMNQNLNNPENIDVTYLMTGICYLQDLYNDTFDAPVQRLLPLVNRDKIYTPTPYVLDLSTYHWGLGQAGLSATLTDRSPDLLIGAPGVTHWIGSLIRYDAALRPTVGHFATSDIAKNNRYTYLGYAVTSGRFYKNRELWYVAGAPRSANYRGETFTFQLKGSSGEVRLESSLVGSSFGEYFGAAVAAVDLNGDSFDDLIVGAPLFSKERVDEGRIYVYLGTGRGNFLVSSQMVDGKAVAGRFGSCISPVKDLDRDGYNDVAVGAPYEDGRGAVYIYRGFSKGLQTTYSQRIAARDIYPHLRGFGVSISRPVDIDGNNYQDIAVGSFLSGHVVLIRSRPVITLHTDVRTQNTTLIDRRNSHFNFTLCSRYSGSDAPATVDTVTLIHVDPLYGRATLDPNTSAYRQSTRLRRNHISCQLHSVLLNLSDNNFSPIQITVKSEVGACMQAKRSLLLISDRETKVKDEFSKNCPVGDKLDHSTEFPFAGICGPDLTCRSDLQLSCAFPQSSTASYVIGSPDPLVFSVRLHNRGEPAHHTKIKIFSDIKLHHLQHHKHLATSDTPRKTFWFDLQPLLSDTYQTNFTFQIDLDALNDIHQPPHINLIAEVFTTSLEANLDNNRCHLSLHLTSHAHLQFYASSSLPSHYVTETDLHQTLNLTHYYEVHKSGVTPLKDAHLTIYVPFSYGTHFLTFHTETADWMMHLTEELPAEVSGESERPPSSDPFEPPPSTAKKPTLLPTDPPHASPPSNRTLFLNCSTPGTACKAVNVFFGGSVPQGLSSYVKVIISLNLTAVGLERKEKDIIQVSTVGVLRSWEMLGKGPKEVWRSAAVSIYEESSELRVSSQVIGLSVLAGGFLLTLIVTGLIKWNFFKRAKRQELQALRDADASFVYFAAAAHAAADDDRN